MITINPDRSASIPISEACIGFERDHLAEYRLFEIKNPLLFDCAFKLDIENTSDIVDLTIAERSEERIVLRWDIAAAMIGAGGVITVQIRAFDTESELIWHSAPMDFTAGRSVDAVNEASTDPIISEFEQVEQRVEASVERCEAAAEDADETLQSLIDEVGDVSETITAFGAHIDDDDNPHGVTASQVGAYTSAQTDTLLNGKLSTSGGAVTGTITGLPTPTADTHAANKKYVDDTTAAAAGMLEESLTADIGALEESLTADMDALDLRLSVAEGALDNKLGKSGGYMNLGAAIHFGMASETAGGGTVDGLASPTAGHAAANKEYVDEGLAEKLDTAGGTVSGNLMIQGKTNLGDIKLHGTMSAGPGGNINMEKGKIDLWSDGGEVMLDPVTQTYTIDGDNIVTDAEPTLNGKVFVQQDDNPGGHTASVYVYNAFGWATEITPDEVIFRGLADEGEGRIKGLGDPHDAWEAANRNYVDRVTDVTAHTDLASVFSSEINAAPYSGDAWAWIKGRVNDGNFKGIHVGDYLTFRVGGYDYHAEVAGINTYKDTGDNANRVRDHIDFITRELYPEQHAYNPNVKFNNGTQFGTAAETGSPWLASDLYLWLNAKAGTVASEAVIGGGTGTEVDYTAEGDTPGIFAKLPAALQAVISEKYACVEHRYSTANVQKNATGKNWYNIGKLWLPSEFEVAGSIIYTANANSVGNSVQYPLFAAGNRVKFKSSNNARTPWLTISPAGNYSDRVCIVTLTGEYSTAYTDTNDYFPICFRVMADAPVGLTATPNGGEEEA